MTFRVAIVVGVLIAGAAAAARADRSETTPLRSPFAAFPMRIGDWLGRPERPLTPEVLKVLGADDYVIRAYSTSTAQVGLFVGYWQSQRQGDTIHSPLNCLPGAGWEPVSREFVALPDAAHPGGAPLQVNRVVIQKGLDRNLVYYWYQSHGRAVASEYWGKFYLIADAVRLNRTDGAIVRVIAPVGLDRSEAAADASARAFIGDLLPALNGYLPE
jgi:EpsI family protein